MFLAKCHLCCKRNTNSTITLAGNINGPSLPVCIVCVPPWINTNTHHWWYEIRCGPYFSDQRKPTDNEIEQFKKERLTQKQDQGRVDSDLYNRVKDKHYNEKFRISELLNNWDEENEEYKFK